MGKTKKSFRTYATINVIFCFMTFYFGCFLLNNCINIVIPYVEEAYAWSRGEVNAVITVAGLLSIIGGFVLIGQVMKVGLKRVLGLAIIITGLFSIVLGMAENFTLFALALAVFQIGSGAAFMIFPGFLLANWFAKTRGRMMGIATVGVPVSGTTCNLIVSALVEGYSFAFAFAAVGVVIILLGVMCFLFVVERPEDVGLAPDGIPLTPEEIAKSRREFAESAKAMPVKKFLTLPETWIYIVAFGILALVMTGVVSQLVPHLMDAGYDSVTANQLFSLNSLVGIPLGLVWGWFSDKTSIRTASAVLALCFAMSSLTIVLSGADRLGMTLFAMFWVATLQGGLPNLETAFIAYVFGRMHFATANRVLRAAVSAFRSLGYAAMGLAYTYTQSYNISYMIFVGISLVAFVLILSVKGCYDSESPRYNRAV